MRVITTALIRGRARHVVVSAPDGATIGEARAHLGLDGTEDRRPLLHGADLVEPVAEHDAPGPWLVVADGPDAGIVAPLPPGRTLSLGRDPLCDIPIHDPTLSRDHIRLRLGRDGVTVEDVGSTNGLDWEQGGVTGVWRTGDRLRLGHSVLTLLPRAPAPVSLTSEAGHLLLTPWPVDPPAPPSTELATPPAPQPRPVRRPGAWTWALPLVVAVGVAAVLRMPWILLFALLGPAMVLGQHLSDRSAARAEHREAVAAHERACGELRTRARAAARHELAARRARDPGPAGAATSLLPVVSTSLWDRTGTPRVVLGEGPLPSGVHLDGRELEHPSAPVAVDLDGPVVLVGSGPAEALLRSVVLQLACRYSPEELRIEVDPEQLADGRWDFVAWLPHLDVGTSARGARRHLRLGADLVVTTDRRHASPGSTVVEVLDHGRAVLSRPGQPDLCLVPSTVSVGTARRLARRLAPLRPVVTARASPGADQLPTASLDALLPWPATVDQVSAAWAAGGAPRTPLGLGAGGARLEVDLVRDGPHALVAGTTGSGKSELLRTLVVGLALTCSPADLALLLVDYKGGSSLAECAALPHTAGLVTDLDPHLAGRMLQSLRAELTRRERLLHAAGARDLSMYAGGDLPRLLIVVDEFRVLAEEVPDVLAGLVRLAAVGRSLGVHLVLATQRPAGVVSADLRANVNLRIALRVRDVADSHDVIDCADAAGLPEGRPGLALLRTGSDPPRSVQVAHLDGHQPGTGVGWQVTEHLDVWAAARAVAEAAPGPSDSPVPALAQLLTAAAARSGLRAPSVWRPPLPDRLVTDPATPRAWAVVDRPERQVQEPLVWDARGHIGLVGAARSGRTTAVASLLQRLEPSWVVVLDLGRGLEALGLTESDSWCARVLPDEQAHGLRVLDLLAAEVARRQAATTDSTTLVVVIDGWDRFVDLFGELERGRGVELALRVLREGPAVGVVAVISGDRSLLLGRLATLLPQTWALPLNDPSDLLLGGLRASQVPRDRPPGRVVDVRTGAVAQVVTPDGGGAGSAERVAPPGPPPFRCRALPRSWRGDDGGAGRCPGDQGWALGGDDPAPLPVPPGHVLVLGPPGSGRSWTLAALARARGSSSLLVRGGDPPGEAELRAALEGLEAGSVVQIDDAHLLAGTPAEDVLLAHSATRGRDLLVAADLDAPGSTFHGLLPFVARSRTGVVLNARSPGDGSLLGVSVPVGDALVPGRGVLVQRGRCTRVQVVAPPAPPDGRSGGADSRATAPDDP